MLSERLYLNFYPALECDSEFALVLPCCLVHCASYVEISEPRPEKKKNQAKQEINLWRAPLEQLGRLTGFC